VWICPFENGHIQAVGRDARGRKQYRYHPLYRQIREETKFGRMLAFGAALPKIRKRVEEDLALPLTRTTNESSGGLPELLHSSGNLLELRGQQDL
jgi:DNA topoisomerase IB